MSEYKFACPVCGQHMACDSSQSGAVMDCPTCFQKIVAPQAPADDQKFILTGTKLSDKKPAQVPGQSATVVVENKFPAAAFFFLILALAAGAGVFVFRGKIFHSSVLTHPAATNRLVVAPKAPKPVLIAPAANDTNWMLVLGTNAISDSPVAGRIHGLDFIVDRASFHDGVLILREGTRGPLDFGCMINFSGALVEALAGQTINVMTNADQAAKVSLRWKGENSGRQNFENGYALRLEFGALTNNHLPGKIYLCTPDPEQSYLMGTFNADARKPKPKAPKK